MIVLFGVEILRIVFNSNISIKVKTLKWISVRSEMTSVYELPILDYCANRLSRYAFATACKAKLFCGSRFYIHEIHVDLAISGNIEAHLRRV